MSVGSGTNGGKNGTVGRGSGGGLFLELHLSQKGLPGWLLWEQLLQVQLGEEDEGEAEDEEERMEEESGRGEDVLVVTGAGGEECGGEGGGSLWTVAWS